MYNIYLPKIKLKMYLNNNNKIYSLKIYKLNSLLNKIFHIHKIINHMKLTLITNNYSKINLTKMLISSHLACFNLTIKCIKINTKIIKIINYNIRIHKIRIIINNSIIINNKIIYI
jgi:hypothetical protein